MRELFSGKGKEELDSGYLFIDAQIVPDIMLNAVT